VSPYLRPAGMPPRVNDHIPFYDTLADLDISFGLQTGCDNSGFNSLVADHLHNGDPLAVQQRRQRNGDSVASLSGVYNGPAKHAGFQPFIEADRDTDFAQLSRRIDRLETSGPHRGQNSLKPPRP
jgi:hypothetical protein